MFNKILSRTLIFCLLTIQLGHTKTNQITTIIETHDAIMATSPNAGDSEFQKSTLQDLKKALSAATQGATKHELQASLNEILAQIPSEAKRQQLKDKMKYASSEELTVLLTSPELMSEAFQGQTSNFVFESSSDWLIAAAAVLLLYVIIEAIYIGIKYDDFKSYSISYSTYYNSTCSSSELTNSERSEIRADAMSKCKAYAARPSTCKPDGYESAEYFDRDYYGNITSGSCSVVARTIAKKK